MLEYYADLMHKTKTNHELLESFLVRYFHLKSLGSIGCFHFRNHVF